MYYPNHYTHSGNPTYTVEVGCYNCHADMTVIVSKGQLLDTVPCPKCGCKTLIPRK